MNQDKIHHRLYVQDIEQQLPDIRTDVRRQCSMSVKQLKPLGWDAHPFVRPYFILYHVLKAKIERNCGSGCRRRRKGKKLDEATHHPLMLAERRERIKSSATVMCRHEDPERQIDLSSSHA